MHSYIQEGRFCMKKRSSRGNTGENALQEWISDHIRYLVMIILLLLAGVVIATVVGLTGGVRSDRSRRNIPGSGAVVSGAELRESAENTPEEDPQGSFLFCLNGRRKPQAYIAYAYTDLYIIMHILCDYIFFCVSSAL